MSRPCGPCSPWRPSAAREDRRRAMATGSSSRRLCSGAARSPRPLAGRQRDGKRAVQRAARGRGRCWPRSRRMAPGWFRDRLPCAFQVLRTLVLRRYPGVTRRGRLGTSQPTGSKPGREGIRPTHGAHDRLHMILVQGVVPGAGARGERSPDVGSARKARPPVWTSPTIASSATQVLVVAFQFAGTYRKHTAVSGPVAAAPGPGWPG